jgi:hypothetical protein
VAIRRFASLQQWTSQLELEMIIRRSGVISNAEEAGIVVKIEENNHDAEAKCGGIRNIKRHESIRFISLSLKIAMRSKREQERETLRKKAGT